MTTPTNHPSRRQPKHLRRSLTSLALALVALVVATVQAPHASAVQYYGAVGWYGGLTPYKVSHYDQWSSGPGAVVMAGLLVGGPVVTRSNGAAGAQRVEISYVVTRFHDGGWTSPQQFTYNYGIPAGVSQVKLPDFRMSAGATGGRFNVRFAVAWYDSYNRWLGGRAVNYNGAGTDYTCTYSHYVGCLVGTGFIIIGTAR